MRTLDIARTDLRRRLRNRSAVVTAFVGPLVLAVVFGLLVGGTSRARFTIGVVDADGTPTTQQIVEGLFDPAFRQQAGGVSFRRLGSTDAGRHAVDRGDVDAAVVIPAGFSAATTGGGSSEIEVLRSPDRVVSGQVAAAVAQRIAGAFRAPDLAVRTLATVSSRAPTADEIAAAIARTPALALADLPAGDRTVDAHAFYGAAMSILFLFFTVGFAGRSVLAEQRDGTLARVLATPTSPAEVLGGKVASVSVLGLAGFVTVWLATTFGFGADWGNSAAVVVLMVATVAAVGGVSLFVAGFARTERQADAVASATTFVLALVGGNFVGPNSPPLLRRLGLFTPNGWALRGFTDLSADTIGLGGVGRPLVALMGFAALFGATGLVRLHRRMAP